MQVTTGLAIDIPPKTIPYLLPQIEQISAPEVQGLAPRPQRGLNCEYSQVTSRAECSSQTGQDLEGMVGFAKLTRLKSL